MAEPTYTKVKFDVQPEQFNFRTPNGHKLGIVNMNLSADDAAALAFLINQPEELEVRIKIKD